MKTFPSLVALLLTTFLCAPKVKIQAAPIYRLTPQEAQLELRRKQLRQWIRVAIYDLNLNQLAQHDLGWFIAEFQPDSGSGGTEERGVTKNGVTYIVPGSQKSVLKGRCIVLASLGTVEIRDNNYRIESKRPFFYVGNDPDSYFPTEILIRGGIGLTHFNFFSHGPFAPLLPVPKEWANDIKAAVAARRQDPARGDLGRRTLPRLLEMLPLASPVESFPIFRAILAESLHLDAQQNQTLRQIFLEARGLKRAVWLAQIAGQRPQNFSLGQPPNDLISIFTGAVAAEVAAQVSDEDAVSLLTALQIANVSFAPPDFRLGFSYDLLRALAAQTRFQASPDQTPSDDQIQIRTLLGAMRALDLREPFLVPMMP